jgi:hypothetical protein
VNAAADYAAAVAQLSRPLPAYVAYTDRASGGLGPFRGTHTTRVVVRTADGQVISGSEPTIYIGATATTHDDIVTKPPFRPACYSATSTMATTYDGRPAERIALRGGCEREKKDADFDALFVDPVTHTPLAVVGHDDDPQVAVRLSQRFAVVDGYVVPASIAVTVVGHGWMTWLNVDAHIDFSDYRFSSTPPSH